MFLQLTNKTINTSKSTFLLEILLFTFVLLLLVSCNSSSVNSQNNQTEKSTNPQPKYNNLFLQTVSSKLKEIPSKDKAIEYRLLKEYGSLWINKDKDITLPPFVAFYTPEATNKFHGQIKIKKVEGYPCKLQYNAAVALEEAIKEAQSQGIKLNPRGNDSCIRTYEKTHQLWLSRVEPNLKHYVGKGKLTQAEADKVKKAEIWQQVKLVLDIEKEKGLLFDKYRQTSILNSVAAPGTSQHLSGLAFDLEQFNNPAARKIMNKHGWYQTIDNDLPHFTYLGQIEIEDNLVNSGLKKVSKSGYSFWLPDL